jgi:hypothetical protein
VPAFALVLSRPVLPAVVLGDPRQSFDTAPDPGIKLEARTVRSGGMTAAEAAALLTPEQQAWLDEFVASAPPLADEQKDLLAALFASAKGGRGRH